jgi:hypothetical protein
MNCKRFVFTRHANEQMFARAITVDNVIEAVNKGEQIASYPDDRPYPSYLVFYIIKQRPIHVVVAVDDKSKLCTVITTYEPSRDIWESDFMTRKKE